MAWCGVAWRDLAKAWQGIVVRCLPWYGVAHPGHGKACHGMAWHAHGTGCYAMPWHVYSIPWHTMAWQGGHGWRALACYAIPWDGQRVCQTVDVVQLFSKRRTNKNLPCLYIYIYCIYKYIAYYPAYSPVVPLLG